MSRIYEDYPGAFSPGQKRIKVPGQSWLQMIQNDPRYIQHKTDLAGLSASDAARRQASVRQALISLGAVPDLKNALSGLSPQYQTWLNQDVNQGVLDQAGANQYSFLNQENKTHDANLTNSKDMLAAKGILSSGQTGYEVGQENYRHSGSLNDAVQNLLGILGGQYGDFATAEGNRATDLGAYGDQVRQMLLGEGANPAGSPGNAQFDPSSGLYVLDGKYYNDQGTQVPIPAGYGATPANPAHPTATSPPPAPPPPPIGHAQSLIRQRVRRHRRR